MSGFDTILMVDWSARAKPSPAKPSADAIWMAQVRGGDVACRYFRTRHDVCAALEEIFAQEIAAGRRVLAGFDFPFGYPAGFAQLVTGSSDPLELWAWLAKHVQDAPNNANNRFDVARSLNLRCPGLGPFWGSPVGTGDDILPEKGSKRQGHGLPERRRVEGHVTSAKTCWQLFGNGSVGSQALLGIARLQRFRTLFGDDLAVAPFQDHDAPIVLSEVYPSLLAQEIDQLKGMDEIKDRAQVRVLAQTLARLAPGELDRLLGTGDAEEGWIMGVGSEDILKSAIPEMLTAPPLRNDCFALPAGVDWIPVGDALAHLRKTMTVRTGMETRPLVQALGRILAQDVIALRSNPPHPNTAVDGYGFAGGRSEGAHTLPLVNERAAAGDTAAPVPAGHAIRVLTGAALPPGVDTVILQEDVNSDQTHIAFQGPVKQGANTRAAGEDVCEGDVILAQGRKLTPADLALAAATGHGALPVREELRVGVLSTGDELSEPGAQAQAGHIFDANRPMLLSLIAQWGMMPVDLGRAPDERETIKATLDQASRQADVILTSGGASAGDEDHISALLNAQGAMEMWRIAVKPGRPLALGLWNGVPVFGLPGNPVAALVCSLIFARPAIGALAGQGWHEPHRVMLPAAFTKRKKPGRREYLRARLRDGHVDVFASEGSGRISGLSWAEGLVELPEEEMRIAPGDPVAYIPFSAFD